MAIWITAREHVRLGLRYYSSFSISPLAAQLQGGSDLITPETFARDYLSRSRPGLFFGLVKGKGSPYRWPACEEWSSNGSDLSGLRNIEDIQDKVVEVEISPPGRGYGDAIASREQDDSKWMKLNMPFGTFLDAFIENKVPWQGRNVERTVGYVAQQDLFRVSATMTRQCPPLPHTIAGGRGDREQWRRNVWIGGVDSFTPIHCDPYENVFVQVVGSKRVHLFHPSMAPLLYLFSSSKTGQGNTSSIPKEDYLLDQEKLRNKFPQLEDALHHQDTRQATLNSGDMLYIPKGWYHCFRSTTNSASVNAWFR